MPHGQIQCRRPEDWCRGRLTATVLAAMLVLPATAGATGLAPGSAGDIRALAASGVARLAAAGPSVADAAPLPPRRPLRPEVESPPTASAPTPKGAVATDRAAPGASAAPVAAPTSAPAPFTLSQKIGRMILIGFPGQQVADPGVRRVAELLRAGRLGGVLLLGHNIGGPSQIDRLIAHLRQSAMGADGSGLPPLIAVDQEGGRVQRLGLRAGFSPVPSAEQIGRRGESEAQTVYAKMAAELAALGVNFNLGPVVDLAVDPRNPVIVRNRRSYGRDPTRVTALAAAFIAAHRAERIATAVKHFPGHGSSTTDTHIDPADVTDSWTPAEVSPYARLASRGLVDAVMMAHVAHDALTGARDLPASLSEQAISEHLRGLVGPVPVVVTDDLEMAAVRAKIGLEAAAIAAIAAGADLVLFSNTWRYDPQRVDRLIEAVAKAVRSGRIPPGRIEEATARLDRLRARIR
ncbi:MAG: glycoside hydrolase family 3 N-terminal domain-containing protein [Pikeienuella sp.]